MKTSSNIDIVTEGSSLLPCVGLMPRASHTPHLHAMDSSQSSGSLVWTPHTKSALSMTSGLIDDLCRMQALTKKEFQQILWPASMHAIGHIAANLSFAAVAISLTHTVKTLEPAFNVMLSQALLGVSTPAPVVATLIPIMVRAWLRRTATSLSR